MIRIIFFVVAFLMLVGGVIGGLYYWGVDPLAKLGLHLNAAPAAPAGPPAPAPPAFVDFGLLLVPVIQDHEVRHQAEMIVRLQVDPDKKEAVAQELPRLQASYLEDMMDYLPMALRDSSDLDLPAIRLRLMAVSARVMASRTAVKDIIIENSELK